MKPCLFLLFMCFFMTAKGTKALAVSEKVVQAPAVKEGTKALAVSEKVVPKPALDVLKGAKKPAPPLAEGQQKRTPSSDHIEEHPIVAITPFEYCLRFAHQYAKNLSYSYQPDSLKLTKEIPPNIPEDPILAKYTCQFQVVNGDGGYRDSFITLFLVEDYDLANLIKEPRWFLIPISYIRSAENEGILANVQKMLNVPSEESENTNLVEGHGIFISHEKSPALVPAKEPLDLQRGRTPKAYCQSYAEAYSKRAKVVVSENAIVLKTEGLIDKMEKWATNFFQPRGSKFIAGYKCQFKTDGPSDKEKAEILVYLFLVETYSFAKYTTMGNYPYIPIEYIKDPVSKKEGYAVFKFLEKK